MLCHGYQFVGWKNSRVIRVIDQVNCRINRLRIVIYMTITTTTVNIKNVSKINK